MIWSYFNGWLINRSFRSEIDLGVGKKQWSEFLESIEIRNRITHPKKATSFLISDNEIEACKNTSSWFNELTHQSLQAFLKISSEKKDNDVKGA